MKLSKMKELSAPVVCNSCGSCCRNFAYILLSQYDIKRLEDFTGLNSVDFTDNIDTNGEKKFMKFQENGDCIFLKIKNGYYSCMVYEARSETCRDYPSSDIQREACRYAFTGLK